MGKTFRDPEVAKIELEKSIEKITRQFNLSNYVLHDILKVITEGYLLKVFAEKALREE